jgi:hypothetical protein
MTFKPFPRHDRWYALLIIPGLIALDVLAVRRVLERPVDGVSFLLSLWVLASLLILVYLAYRIVGAFTLEYWVDRDAVTLIWGPTRQIVPIGQIRRIQRGAADPPKTPPRPWHWPCPDRRRVRCAGLGMVNAYATRPLTEQIILVTGEESYGISPADPEGLLAALQARYALGAARPRQAELVRPPLWTWPLWRDRSALFLIGVGLLGLLVLFGALCFRFPLLSSDLPLHFDVSGLPDRIAPKTGLFALPIIGLVTWALNLAMGIGIYRRAQRHGAYLVWGGAVIVQGIAGLALFNLMRW